LHVAIEAVVERRFFAGLEIEDEERRLVTDAPNEGERLPVGRRRGPDRAAGTDDERFDLAGFPVEALDDVDLRVRIFVVLKGRAGRGVVAVVNVAAVGRKGRLSRVFLLGPFLRQLQPLAAAPVVEPDLAGAER